MAEREVATLAGGCFWCLEAVFEELRGVESVKSGYAGGSVPNPRYDDVCTGRTGHAEVVQVAFDPAEVSFRELLEVFFTIHDPTTLNQQGADRGTQYRSAIFTHSPEQAQTARESLERAQPSFRKPIATQIVTDETPFWPAEEYHQQYLVKNGRATCAI
jgi:peptide-methionine (S)-S-oxide reductase